MEKIKEKDKKTNGTSAYLVIGILLFYIVAATPLIGFSKTMSITSLNIIVIFIAILVALTTLEGAASTLFQSLIYLMLMVLVAAMLSLNATLDGMFQSAVIGMALIAAGTIFILYARMYPLLQQIKAYSKKVSKES